MSKTAPFFVTLLGAFAVAAVFQLKHLMRVPETLYAEVAEVIGRGLGLFAIGWAASTAVFSQSAVDQQTNDKASGGVMQPEGKTGRSFIKPGGAPALAPKGETPAGMQAAPRGSSKTIETDKKGIAEGTAKN